RAHLGDEQMIDTNMIETLYKHISILEIAAFDVAIKNATRRQDTPRPVETHRILGELVELARIEQRGTPIQVGAAQFMARLLLTGFMTLVAHVCDATANEEN